MRWSCLYIWLTLLAVVRLSLSFLPPSSQVVRHFHHRGIGIRRRSIGASNDGTQEGRFPSFVMATGKKKRKASKGEDRTTKVADRAIQREAETLVQAVLTTCGDKRRDLEAIAGTVEQLKALTSTTLPAKSASLNRDWRLIFASDDDALSTVGTGLHKLPLTRMEDFFLTLRGVNSGNREVTVIEVLRVLGPFPNIRNKLTGDCRSTGPTTMTLRYSSMVDGTGKELDSSRGELERTAGVTVAFVNNETLVMATRNPRSKSAGQLVFVNEPDIDSELAKLRVEG